MSKTYKGYELAEAVDNGVFSLEQRVNGAGYFNCTIGFILKEVGTNFLFKNFKIIEEQEDIDIQSIEEIKDIFIENSSCGEDVKYLARKYNEILKWAKQLDKKIKEER